VTLTEDIRFFEQRLREMAEEAVELQARVAELERHNQILQKELEEASRAVGSGFSPLTKLYDEGFHVCHASYASPRDLHEDCPWCLSLLHHRGRNNAVTIAETSLHD